MPKRKTLSYFSVNNTELFDVTLNKQHFELQKWFPFYKRSRMLDQHLLSSLKTRTVFFYARALQIKQFIIDAIYISGRDDLFCSEWAYTSSVAVLLVLFITSVATKTIHQQKFRNILIGQPNISIESRTVFMQRTKCIYESKQNPAFLYCFRSELSFSPLYWHCWSLLLRAESFCMLFLHSRENYLIILDTAGLYLNQTV